MLSLDSGYKKIYTYRELNTYNGDFSYKQQGKVLFDICAALLVTILVLSWLIPILEFFIWLNSPGPIFYIQRRTGFRGISFRCLKLRTMVYDPKASFLQATKNDTRITAIGRFLRRTNLDEVPQFINVLLGDMSLVGPRPHAVEHSAQFWYTMPDYRKRYRIKPGITGLAQVRGCRGTTDQLIKMQHRVKYDRFYQRKKSLGFDIWICWLTFKSVFKKNDHAF